MSRTPARITQADVARAIRAAKQAGVGPVKILLDGTILIETQPRTVTGPQQIEIALDEDIAL